MAWKLLEEASAEGKGKGINNLELESILQDICVRLGKIKSSTQNLSISQDLKSELQEIWNKLSEIEQKVNNFPSVEQVAGTAITKVTPTLEKLSKEIEEAKHSVIQASSGVRSSNATTLRHVSEASTNFKNEIKNYLEQKFVDLLKTIPNAVTQSTSDISSGFTTLSTTQEAIKEQLTKFLKDDLPTLLSKTTNDLGADFQTDFHTADKSVNNWQDMFNIEFRHLNKSIHNSTKNISTKIKQLNSGMSNLSLTAPFTLNSSLSILEKQLLPIFQQLVQHIWYTRYRG